jgi:hypothetical protein
VCRDIEKHWPLARGEVAAAVSTIGGYTDVLDLVLALAVLLVPV